MTDVQELVALAIREGFPRDPRDGSVIKRWLAHDNYSYGDVREAIMGLAWLRNQGKVPVGVSLRWINGACADRMVEARVGFNDRMKAQSRGVTSLRDLFKQIGAT